MASCCAAFGPNDGYVFKSDHTWATRNVPPRVLALLRDEKPRAVHEVALGPDGSYAITYTTSTGGLSMRHHDLPTGLQKWLIPKTTVDRDILSLQIALGPNNAFFAFDNKGSVWGNLPPRLNEIVKANQTNGRTKPGRDPRSVSFGPNGNYVFTTTDGAAWWDLPDEHPALDTILKSMPSLRFTVVIISPTIPGRYLILHCQTGNCSADIETAALPNYKVFAEDLKKCLAALLNKNRQAASKGSKSNTARNINKGLGLLNQVLKVANAVAGGANGGGGGGGGDGSDGGGMTFVTTDSGSNNNNFWTPITSAASDPVQ